MLQTAIDAARQAGRAIAERYPTSPRVTIKGCRDLVSEADMEAQELILDLIRTRFPDHAVVSEESGKSTISKGYTWVVDPLDGTTNYVHHHPVFAVSIALLKDGAPIIGVIHDPSREHVFVAERGKGAKLNNQSMHVSTVKTLGDALVGFDWGHTDEGRARILTHLHPIVPRCGTLRVLGSATLSLAYVAVGWMDAYFQLSLKAWDTAAGTLIVTEAGGRCSTPEGEAYRVDFPGCLATNALIHDELLGIMRSPPST